ncbi:hypothetical protein F4009_13095 [Candidatus Poribacteria bacterium]|nr:hypothetical protein [Candidatus Poribacteria bacterium]MYH84067.1 hypothetical protein [Candidatus Poribacteria bacterium]MYK94910.1 hypothetical protein [Candidatus Poribacteria bacterium]
MKSKLTFSSFFYLTSILSLLLCFGCGDTEDDQEAPPPTNNTLLDEPNEQSLQLAEQQRWLTDADWKKLKDAEQWLHLTVEDWVNLKERDWEKLKGKDWIRLTNREIREFMNLEIPRRWVAETKDEALREKFSIAARFQKLGNIPQLRYEVEFRRKWKQEAKDGFVTVTPEFAKYRVGDSAATYFLVPTEAHRQLLEDDIKQLKSIVAQEKRRFMEQLRIEDPEAWIKDMRTFLIDKHGDIPEVDTIVNFLRKLELNLPRTDEECFAYLRVYSALYLFGSHTALIYESYAWLEASDQLRHIIGDPPKQTNHLEKYRAARAAGLSFYNIKWGDD